MVFERNRLEEMAKEGDTVTARLSLANIPIFSMDVPERKLLGERFTLRKLSQLRTGKDVVRKIVDAANEYLKKEYKENLLEAKPDLDAPISLSHAGGDGRSELYDIICNYKIKLKPKEQELPYGD